MCDYIGASKVTGGADIDADVDNLPRVHLAARVGSEDFFDDRAAHGSTFPIPPFEFLGELPPKLKRSDLAGDIALEKLSGQASEERIAGQSTESGLLGELGLQCCGLRGLYAAMPAPSR